MKLIKQTIPLVFLLTAFCAPAGAATEKVVSTDSTRTGLQLRGGASLTRKFTHRLTLHFEEEVRFKDYGYTKLFDSNNEAVGKDYSKSLNFDRSYTFVGVDFRTSPYFKAGLGYTLILIDHDGKKSTSYDNYWTTRHRLQVDATGNLRINQWKLSLCERALANIRFDDINSLEKNQVDLLLRSKLSAEYTCRRYPLKPYAFFELSNTLNAIGVSGVDENSVPIKIDGNYIEKIRLCAGLKYRINTRNSLEFYYRFDIGNDRDINYDYKKDKVTIKQIDVVELRTYTSIVGINFNFDWI